MVFSSASLSPAASPDPALRQKVGQLGETLTSTRNTLAEVLTKVDILESQGTVAGKRDILWTLDTGQTR